ncbi:hypothetical protein F2Q69_00039773 [Brassica cretica]|uniref:Uncharacterized protein n=1 Tax=Brassica cretica TaxID=69181 RepID=A0A8S9NNE6_BRACR|nr:hypothetical protein F2Q69_00039773 [Brassica cretica]
MISEDASGFFVSLLFRLGPLLGGVFLVASTLTFRLQHALLMGVASGIAFVLGLWPPLQLLLSAKMRFIPLVSLLAIGAVLSHFISSTILNVTSRKKSRAETSFKKVHNLVVNSLAESSDNNSVILETKSSSGEQLNLPAPMSCGDCGIRIIQAAAGAGRTILISDSGNVYSCGKDSFGEAEYGGQRSNVPGGDLVLLSSSYVRITHSIFKERQEWLGKVVVLWHRHFINHKRSVVVVVLCHE